jgi:hypothetical protein
LDGKVAEGDNDMQCVKPKYETKLAARSGSAGKSLGQGSSDECWHEDRALCLPTKGKLFWYNDSRITNAVQKASDILTVLAFPGAIGCVCRRNRIATSFKGMKFFDETIVRLYLRTSCNERGKGARDERGKLKTSLDNGKRLVDRDLPSRHH